MKMTEFIVINTAKQKLISSLQLGRIGLVATHPALWIPFGTYIHQTPGIGVGPIPCIDLFKMRITNICPYRMAFDLLHHVPHPVLASLIVTFVFPHTVNGKIVIRAHAQRQIW